jgi:hypothetical protein
MQRDAAMRSMNIVYFTAKSLYMFRVPFTPINRSTRTVVVDQLVQVICHN